MILQVGVKVILKNSEDKILLLKRNFLKYPDMDTTHIWDLPGGRIVAGSTLIENLKREVLEETGLRLTTTPKILNALDILRGPEKHVVRICFIAEADGKITLTDEHEAYEWLTPKEALNLSTLDPYAREEITIYLNE